mmetsp:Transcript_15725/g.39980  ORF Transcript_15725/g.39980 Transcript_15725/m.39980 type:complete len:351 (-) Transcript_15725:93-1145(-)
MVELKRGGLPLRLLRGEGLEHMARAFHLLCCIPHVHLKLVPMCHCTLVLELQILNAGMDGAQCFTLLLQAGLLLQQLALRAVQGVRLGPNHILGVVVHVYGKNPATQARRCLGHLGNRLGIELGLRCEVVNLFDDTFRNRVLVKGEQYLHEVDLSQQLHALTPPQGVLYLRLQVAPVLNALRYGSKHVAHSLHHHLHAHRRVLQALELRNIALVDVLQLLERAPQGRHGSLQIRIALIPQAVSFHGRLLCGLLLDLQLLLHHAGLVLLRMNALQQPLCLVRGRQNGRLDGNERLLQLLDLVGKVLHVVHSLDVLVMLVARVGLHVLQHRWHLLQKLQELGIRNPEQWVFG